MLENVEKQVKPNDAREPTVINEKMNAHAHRSGKRSTALRCRVVGGLVARRFSLFTRRDNGIGRSAVGDTGDRRYAYSVCVRVSEKDFRRYVRKASEDVFSKTGVTPPLVMEQTSLQRRISKPLLFTLYYLVFFFFFLLRVIISNLIKKNELIYFNSVFRTC